jgi:quercetin dioxygenase-like cupin family protein
MTMQAQVAGTVVRRGGGRVMQAFGDELTVLLSSEDTGGKYSLFNCVTRPGGGPPRHRHLTEDEWFHVLEGRMEFWKDGRWEEVEPGGTVFVPRGVAHAFRNRGKGDLRMVVQTAPGGFEVFYARLSEELAKGGEPDFGKLMAIAREHGMEILGEAEGSGAVTG